MIILIVMFTSLFCMVFLPGFCDCEPYNSSTTSNLSNLDCINVTTYLIYILVYICHYVSVCFFLLWSLSKEFWILNLLSRIRVGDHGSLFKINISYKGVFIEYVCLLTHLCIKLWMMSWSYVNTVSLSPCNRFPTITLSYDN